MTKSVGYRPNITQIGYTSHILIMLLDPVILTVLGPCYFPWSWISRLPEKTAAHCTPQLADRIDIHIYTYVYIYGADLKGADALDMVGGAPLI